MLALALLVAACRPTPSSPSLDQQEMKWRADRAARLRSDNGWLTLTGLFWLSDGSNDVTIPAHPPVHGTFVLENGKVTLQPIPGTSVTKPTLLHDDTEPSGPTIITLGTTSLQAIKRGDVHGDRYAIRVKDTNSDARTHFLGLDYFPVNPKLRVDARFEPYRPAKKIAITNVLGMTSDEVSPGRLVFTVGGKTYHVDPILEQGEKDLFIIFRDATSGKETYGAARYVYAHPPDASGRTIIDFNHAYNPPCAFTPFATCPLPPPQNRLPIRIEAGELKYRGGHA